MKTKKTIFALMLLIVAAVQIHAELVTKTVEITEYVYVSSPQHIEGTTYRAADGTEVTVPEGEDANDSRFYIDENGNHGVPSKQMKRTYTIQYLISEELDTPENEAVIAEELHDTIAERYNQSGGTKTTISEFTEVPVNNRIPSSTYQRTITVLYSGKIEETVVENSQAQINQSNSEQLGDPVLMTSGQYRYDEIDISISIGNAELELGRHYQSEENRGESIGRKWFFSLDTRVLRGTSLSSEQTYSEAMSSIYTLTSELNSLKTNRDNLEIEYGNSINKLTEDIGTTDKAIDCLENCNYKSYQEIKDCIRDLNVKRDVLQDILDEFKNDKREILRETNNYITEFERQLGLFQTSAASIKLIADLSAYNRRCNTRAENGYGFNEHTEIGTQIITVYDTYGRKSLYQVTTEAQPTPNGTGNPYPNGAETKSLSGGTDTLRIKPDGTYALTKRDGTTWLYGADGMLRSITDRNNNKITISYENGKAVSISVNESKLWKIEWQGGRISAIINVRDFSDRIEYFYNNGRLSGVKDNDGDTISFGYMDCSGDYLDLIQKPDGSIVRIEYGYVRDGAKLVSRTSNEEGVWETFSYSQSGKKVEHTTHSGVVTLYEYDDNHLLTKQTDADGTIKEYGYDDDGNISWEKHNGNKTNYIYNSFGDKTRANYSDGSYETWTYDSFGQITSQKDRDGTVYEYIRDTHGNLTALRCGGKTLYSYVYDAKGKVTSVTMHRADGTCYTQRFSYDINGNLKERIIGDGNAGSIKETWTYDERNRVLTYSVNEKLQESYSYDGRQTTVTASNGLVTTYTTDCRKDCISVEEKDTVTGEIRLTETEYDKRHLPVKRTLSAGKDETPIVTAEYRYLPGGEVLAELMRSGVSIILTIYDYTDANGKQTDGITKMHRLKCTEAELEAAGVFDTDGLAGADLEVLLAGADDSYVISYSREITQNGTRLTVTTPDGTRTTTDYDAWSRPIASTDASGITSLREYSPAGRLKKAQSSYGGFIVYSYDATGNLAGAGRDGGIMSSSASNPDGNPYRTTDRKGRTTEYAYDSMNRLAKVTQAAGSRYFYYDDHGRVTLAVTGGDGSISKAEEYTAYEYSDDGRTMTASFGGLYPVTYNLNAWGETISVTDGEGNTRHYKYDCTGRAVSATDAYGNITSYEYDVRGLVTKAVYPDGTESEYKYDVFGNMTESVLCGKTVWQGTYDSAGRIIESSGNLSPDTSYRYDSAGRISEILTADETTTSYAYDDRGRTVTVTSGNGHAYTYNYDEFGILDSETNRIGLTQNYMYDKNDEISSLQRFSGAVTSYTESQDCLTKITSYSDGTSGTVTYTLSGKIKSIKNASGEVFYEYDKGGMLIKQTDTITGETVSYSYDKAGRKIRTIGEGQNLTMSYGKNGELVKIHDSVTNTGFKLEYDTMMREIKRTAENGVRTETLYNQDSTVECIITRNPRGAVIGAEAYVYGEDGRKEASIDTEGEVTLYEYDKQGRLSAVLHPDTEATAEYERKILDDLKLSELRFTASESRYLSKKVYEKVARLQILCHNIVSMIPSYRNFRAERFKYDADGNMIERQIGGALIEYTYDADDRLVSCNNGGKTLRTYSYDDDGNLIKITDPSAPNVTNEFAYDGSGRMVSSITNNEGARLEQTYGYDALGRRVRTSGYGRGTVRTTYDGTGMNVLRETNDRGITTNGAASIPVGERYRYLDDSTSGNGRTSGYTSSGDDSMNGTAGFRTRTTLYIGSSPAAVSADGESRYLSGDDIGSVRCVTDAYGRTTAALSYDVFGTPLTDAEYGNEDIMLDAVISRAAYTGKPYDYATGLYDYGFRDYSPALARFTTPDPIRDGTNWYAYCANDPVNFVDAWGLKEVIAGDIVQLNNDKIISNSTGNLKKQTYIEVQRTEGHTEGHYLSTISINVKTKNDDVVSLFSNPVQSWADRANENNRGFTLQAGEYEGRLYGYTGSYLKPIGLINEDLGVTSNDNMLIHGNVMNKYDVGSAERIYWYNTGSSEGCQILQGQDKAIDTFTTTIENLGFLYGNGYKDYEDTISVIIKDPEGVTTTKDGKEIKNDKNK